MVVAVACRGRLDQKMGGDGCRMQSRDDLPAQRRSQRLPFWE